MFVSAGSLNQSTNERSMAWTSQVTVDSGCAAELSPLEQVRNGEDDHEAAQIADIPAELRDANILIIGGDRLRRRASLS